MSSCTKILVSFDFIGKKEELSSLAFAHRQRVVELSLFSREALSFLDALARGDGVGSGGKGDIGRRAHRGGLWRGRRQDRRQRPTLARPEARRPELNRHTAKRFWAYFRLQSIIGETVCWMMSIAALGASAHLWSLDHVSALIVVASSLTTTWVAADIRVRRRFAAEVFRQQIEAEAERKESDGSPPD